MSASIPMVRRSSLLALVPLAWDALLVTSCRQRLLVADEVASSGGGSGGGESDGGGDGGGRPLGGGGGSAGEPSLTRPIFAAPRRIAELSDDEAKDQDPTLTGDLLEIYFFSDRTGNAEIWSSSRSAPDEPWEAPAQVLELASPELDINPAISLDGLRLWFHSQREPAGIWFSERSSRSVAWSTPVRLDVFGGELAPGPSADELRMGISVRLDGRGREIHESTRGSTTEPWSVPLAIPGLNGPQDDSTPFLWGDGEQIFFSSARTGAGDLYWTARTTLQGAVREPEALSELNDPEVLESHPWISLDRSRIFFGSARSGNTDLYEASAPSP